MENRIRELRKTRGMNQEALANYIGVSQQTISKIERNTNSLSMDILICLAEFFHVTTDYLLGREDKIKICVDGLTDVEVAHIEQIIQDLRKQ